MQTTSYGEAVKINDTTVQMTGADLKALVSEIQISQAENSALKEALQSERQAYGAFEQSVMKLIETQEKERADAAALIKQLRNQLNAPALELYAGYNSEDEWEGGIRIVWRLN